jgi:hypothetical protein
MKKTYYEDPDRLCRIPLFLPVKKREPLQKKELVCPWGTVTFPTIPFTIFDEEVFLTILNYGEYDEAGKCIIYPYPSLYTVTKDMGKVRGFGKYVFDSLQALTETTVKFEIENYIIFSGTLLSFYSHYKKYDNTISVHPVFSKLMKYNKEPEEVVVKGMRKQIKNKQKGTIRHIPVDIRNELSETGKAVLRFICGHKVNYAYKFSLKDIHDATAPHTAIRNFRIAIKETLDRLVELNFLIYGKVQKEGKYDEWILYNRPDKEAKENVK